MESTRNRIKFNCEDCTLHKHCFPHHVDSLLLHQFENIIKRSRVLHKGEYLHRHGDLVESLYIIRSGSVKEFVSNDDGDEQIIAFYIAGEILGLDSISREQYLCSAIALETTTYCSFTLSKFEKMCQQNPDLQKMMFDTMSKVLSFENKMLLTACNKKADEKVATFLLSLSHRYKHHGYSDNALHIPMSRQEIGNYLGITSETVSRVITQLQNLKLISAESKTITITDMEALMELAHSCTSHHNF